MQPSALFALSAVFGLVFGSFANVVIWRLPRGESLVAPGSHCPTCGTPIAWHDNVPVLSWLVLRGRCRTCREPISARYPLVEIASGVLWAAAALRWGASLKTAFAIALFYLLLILSAIDLDHRRLPNPLVALLFTIGVAGAAASAAGLSACPLTGGATGATALLDAAVGVLLGGGVPLLAALLYERVRGRTGLGMGDVKLLGALGLFLGPHVLIALFLGSVVGSVVGLATRARSKEAAIPFGPYLAAGAVVTALWGDGLVAAYLRLAGLA
ncbi:prepilin peptidase [Coriobacteriia bacterium Es71-Z0120]|uniref:prepilin peptidase n=1 Tax=Parvivirga hydrogeniphila TaxID=2939460 RepID=UPI002260C773|nr:A24 family peptidase [Parvivirga hydrogeniphila]MCL4079153.1 prepilin peptidase [Parvivirga hydrogeniphila]